MFEIQTLLLLVLPQEFSLIIGLPFSVLFVVVFPRLSVTVAGRLDWGRWGKDGPVREFVSTRATPHTGTHPQVDKMWKCSFLGADIFIFMDSSCSDQLKVYERGLQKNTSHRHPPSGGQTVEHVKVLFFRRGHFLEGNFMNTSCSDHLSIYNRNIFFENHQLILQLLRNPANVYN